MSCYTSVMVTAGIGNREALRSFAAQWEATHGGEVSLSSNGAVLFLEKNYLDESALHALLTDHPWEHREWLQYWIWREGDGQWVEYGIDGFTFTCKDDAARRWRERATLALLTLLEKGTIESDELREFVARIQQESSQAKKRKEAESAWRQEWDAVIAQRAQAILKGGE